MKRSLRKVLMGLLSLTMVFHSNVTILATAPGFHDEDPVQPENPILTEENDGQEGRVEGEGNEETVPETTPSASPTPTPAPTPTPTPMPEVTPEPEPDSTPEATIEPEVIEEVTPEDPIQEEVIQQWTYTAVFSCAEDGTEFKKPLNIGSGEMSVDQFAESFFGYTWDGTATINGNPVTYLAGDHYIVSNGWGETSVSCSQYYSPEQTIYVVFSYTHNEMIEEEPAEEELVFDTHFEYEDSRVRVIADTNENAGIPENSRIYAEYLYPGTPEYVTAVAAILNGTNADPEKNNEFVLYDIYFLTEDGERIDPNDNVRVTMTFKETITPNGENGEISSAEVVHVDKDYGGELISNNEVITSQEGIEEISFTNDSFSPYGVIYTVDYTYDGYTWSMEGDTSIYLSELFGILSINEDASKAETVEFTNYSYLTIVPTGQGDWLLTSLQPFDTQETLTVSLSNGNTYVIDVTDLQNTVVARFDTSQLPVYLDGGTIQFGNGSPNNITENQALAVGTYDSQDVSLEMSFLLANGGTRPAKGDYFTYQLPSGLSWVACSDVPCTWHSDGDNLFSYSITESGLVTIKAERDLSELSDVHASLSLNGQVKTGRTEGHNEFSFPGGGTITVPVVSHGSVTCEKTSTNFDTASRKATFKVRITGSGTNDSITFKDTLAYQSPMTIDQGSVKFYLDQNCNEEINSSEYSVTYTSDENNYSTGFNGTLNHTITDGGSVYCVYTATLSPNAFIADDWKINNTFGNSSALPSITKMSATKTGEANTSDPSPYISWTIQVNPGSWNGDIKIKDILGENLANLDSSDIYDLKYHFGEGADTTFTDNQKNALFGESGLVLEQTSRDTPKTCVITYKTKIPSTTQIGTLTYKNAVQVQPEGADDYSWVYQEGSVNAGTDIGTMISKSVKVGTGDYGASATSQGPETATWKVTVTIPGGVSLTNAKIEDVVPAGLSVSGTPIVSISDTSITGISAQVSGQSIILDFNGKTLNAETTVDLIFDTTVASYKERYVNNASLTAAELPAPQTASAEYSYSSNHITKGSAYNYIDPKTGNKVENASGSVAWRIKINNADFGLNGKTITDRYPENSDLDVSSVRLTNVESDDFTEGTDLTNKMTITNDGTAHQVTFKFNDNCNDYSTLYLTYITRLNATETSEGQWYQLKNTAQFENEPEVEAEYNTMQPSILQKNEIEFHNPYSTFCIEINKGSQTINGGTSYSLEDQLPKGMILIGGSVKVYADSGKATEITDTVSIVVDSYTDTTGNKITIGNLQDGKYYYIEYRVLIDSKDTLENICKLNTTNSFTASKSVTHDSTKGQAAATQRSIQIQKFDRDTGNRITEGEVTFVYQGYDYKDGVITIRTGDAGTDKGTLTVRNGYYPAYSTDLLADVIYVLKETQAPSGYNNDSDPVCFVFNSQDTFPNQVTIENETYNLESVGFNDDHSVKTVKNFTFYDTKKVSFTPRITKLVSGAEAPAGTYEFSITKTASTARTNDSDILPVTTTTTATVSAVASGQTSASSDAVFEDITYTEKGVYTYEIKETTRSGIDGMTYSTETVTLTVTVSENSSGALVATGEYQNSNTQDSTGKTFTNSYVKESGTASLSVNKKVTGNTGLMSAEEKVATYTFTLNKASRSGTDPNSDVLPYIRTITTTGDATSATGVVATFGAIKYKEAGTYFYTITETAGTINEMTYDIEQKYAKVVVTEISGNLTTAVTYGDSKDTATNSSLTVSNKYSKITYKPEVTKIISGSNVPPETYNFKFEDKSSDKTGESGVPASGSITGAGTVQFGEITYTKAGTYVYEITETPGTTVGMTYSSVPVVITVTVTKGDDGTLSVSESKTGGDTNDGTIKNVYTTPATASLSVTKLITGNSGYDTTEQFAFTLARDSGPDGGDILPTELSASTAVNGRAVFGDITFTKPGNYYYTITESAGTTKGMSYDTAPHYAKVVVAEDPSDTSVLTAKVTYGLTKESASSDRLSISNKYSMITYSPSIAKGIAGDGAPSEKYEFTFEDKSDDKTGESGVPASGSITGAGTVQFSEITYTKAGTYKYEITETPGTTVGMTYSTSTVTITVEVAEESDGTLSETHVISGGDDSDHNIINTFVKDEGIAYLIKTDRDVSESGAVPEAGVQFQVYNAEFTNKSQAPKDKRMLFTKTGTTDGVNVYKFTGNYGTPDSLATESSAGDTLETGTSGMVKITGIQLNQELTAIETKNLPGYQTPDHNPATKLTGVSVDTTPAAAKTSDATAKFVDAPVKSSFTVYKRFSDGNSKHSDENVKITLYKVVNETETAVEEKTLNADNSWKYTWSDLDLRDDSGNLITYKVKETGGIGGYTITYSPNDVVPLLNNKLQTVTVINSKDSSTTRSVRVKKVWDDKNNTSSRPDKVTVHLLANGVDTGKTVELSVDNNWLYLWTALPAKNEEGNLIDYEVTEDAVAGYTTTITGNMSSGYTITNSNKKKSPDTADTMHIFKWAMTLAVSVLAAFISAILLRKKEREER